MPRSKILYEEKCELTAKFSHPKAKEYLNYGARIRIRDSGKTPVEMRLTFDGTPPFVAPMPPEKHSFKAASIAELYSKTAKWFRKYRYELI